MKEKALVQYSRQYKVLVGCMTYNHSKFIEDALNGFVMLQTIFPFLCLVFDNNTNCELGFFVNEMIKNVNL